MPLRCSCCSILLPTLYLPCLSMSQPYNGCYSLLNPSSNHAAKLGQRATAELEKRSFLLVTAERNNKSACNPGRVDIGSPAIRCQLIPGLGGQFDPQWLSEPCSSADSPTDVWPEGLQRDLELRLSSFPSVSLKCKGL